MPKQADDEMPETVFIGPARHKLIHKLVLLRIIRSNEDGPIESLQVVANTKRGEAMNDGSALAFGYLPESVATQI